MDCEGIVRREITVSVIRLQPQSLTLKLNSASYRFGSPPALSPSLGSGHGRGNPDFGSGGMIRRSRGMNYWSSQASYTRHTTRKRLKKRGIGFMGFLETGYSELGAV